MMMRCLDGLSPEISEPSHPNSCQRTRVAAKQPSRETNLSYDIKAQRCHLAQPQSIKTFLFLKILFNNLIDIKTLSLTLSCK